MDKASKDVPDDDLHFDGVYIGGSPPPSVFCRVRFRGSYKWRRTSQAALLMAEQEAAETKRKQRERQQRYEAKRRKPR
jgi:hypothetical protein